MLESSEYLHVMDEGRGRLHRHKKRRGSQRLTRRETLPGPSVDEEFDGEAFNPPLDWLFHKTESDNERTLPCVRLDN